MKLVQKIGQSNSLTDKPQEIADRSAFLTTNASGTRSLHSQKKSPSYCTVRLIVPTVALSLPEVPVTAIV